MCLEAKALEFVRKSFDAAQKEKTDAEERESRERSREATVEHAPANANEAPPEPDATPDDRLRSAADGGAFALQRAQSARQVALAQGAARACRQERLERPQPASGPAAAQRRNLAAQQAHSARMLEGRRAGPGGGAQPRTRAAWSADGAPLAAVGRPQAEFGRQRRFVPARRPRNRRCTRHSRARARARACRGLGAAIVSDASAVDHLGVDPGAPPGAPP